MIKALKFEIYVKLFLNPFNLSLLIRETLKLGTKDICDTWQQAHPVL